MRIHNLYADASGETHFRDIEVEWVEERHGGKLSRRFPASGIIFRQVAPTYDLDWHRHMGHLAPFRQGFEENAEGKPGMREGMGRTNALIQVGYLLVALRAHGLEEDIAWCARESVLDVVPRLVRLVGPAAEVVA